MTAALDFYTKQAESRLSSVPWVAEIQQTGLSQLSRDGFPTTSMEDWKYSSTVSFLKEQFHLPKLNKPSTTAQPLIPEAYRIAIVDGQLRPIDASFPEGVLILPLAEALQQHPEKVKPALSQILQTQHGFQAQNTAMINQGIFVYLPPGVTLDRPVLLAHEAQQSQQVSYLRHVVVLAPNSSLDLVEDFYSTLDAPYYTNTITEVHANDASSLKHYKIQREGTQAYHVGQLSVAQASNSAVESHVISLGGQWVRSDIDTTFQGENATTLMNGIYCPQSGQHMDFHTSVVHAVPNCRSSQDYKGILQGDGRAVFNGKVVVEKHAIQTEANQQNKNLLLSQLAEVDTKPQLNIYADDVTCSHGATIGSLDEDAVFYFTSRGIPRAEAEKCLINAFLTENKQKLSQQAIANWLEVALVQSKIQGQ